MFRTIIPVIILLTIHCMSYAINELQSLDFIPHYSVINSTALASDSGALLLNPAGIYKVDRINAMVSSGPMLSMNYIGFATVVPYFGGSVGLSFFNFNPGYTSAKRGLVAGWGRNFFGVLAAGANIKAFSSDFQFWTDAVMADVGLIFHPNASLGYSWLQNDWLNETINISLVLQNIGTPVRSAEPEDLAVRLGFSYYIKPLWSKLFIDKPLISRSDDPIFGVEIHPAVPFFDIFLFRVSHNTRSLKLGLGITGEDGSLDFSYSFARNEAYLSLNGYFERDREELSSESYNEGMNFYSQAEELENNGSDDADEKYSQALTKFNDALTYDNENNKAALKKRIIEGKMDSFQADFLTKAQAAEARRDPVSALIFFNKANAISENPSVTARIKDYRTNETVTAYVNGKKASIETAIKNGKYFNARKDLSSLKRVMPDDSSIQRYENTIDSSLKATAIKYYEKARSLYAKQMYEDCMTQAKNALAFNPDLDKAQDLYNLASTDLSNKKGVDRATEAFRKKNYLSAYKQLNWALSKNPDNKPAADLKARILKIFKDNQKTYLDNGVNFYNTSEYDRAIEEFDKVLAADPGNNIASDYRTRAISKMKALEKLEEVSEE